MGVKIKERNKGEWWLVVHLNGKRRMTKVGSKKAANDFKKKVEVEIAEARFNISKVKTFSFYCKEWRDDVMPSTCKASTQSDYKGIIKNHLKPAKFWNKPVDEIYEGEIETFLINLRKNKARSTTVHIKNAISNSFKRAVKARAIRINPARGVEIPKDPDNEEQFEASPYNRTETDTLLATCKESYEGSYPMLLFFCRTGCRAGEVAGLQWRDLDLKVRKATIRRGVVRGKVVKTTKSKKIRKIDLTPALVTELKKHKLRTGAGEWVFQNEDGGFVDMNNFRKRIFDPLCEDAELHKTRLHDLRHSYAAAMVVGTKDMYYVQRQLGHASITTTINTYGHWLEEDEEVRPVDILDGATG